MTKDEVLEFITRHATEEDLQDINELTRARYKVLRARSRAQITAKLEPGSLVAFNNDVRPTYLRRATARVIEFRQTKITVELTDGPTGKFRSGRVITDPSLIHIIAGPRRTPEVTQ